LNKKARISSIIQTPSLPHSITQLTEFSLSKVQAEDTTNINLPSNLRLGHLAERVVSGLIDQSVNYELLYENIQLIQEKETVGELDFIIKEIATERLIHLEMAYKFYLYDPRISAIEIENWIGPNRNDSLSKKLDKLKKRQFPLLYSDIAKKTLKYLFINQIEQSVCLLVNLYLPLNFKKKISSACHSAVKGYYLDKATFIALHSAEKKYYLPPRKEWGIYPVENSEWFTLSEIEERLNAILSDKKAALCWEKNGDTFSENFIVWW
jgi:hypothetical protein